VRLISWRQVEKHVLRLSHQQDVWVRKESVVPPQVVGIPYSCGAYRYTTQDGRAIDIKEDRDYYPTHWDWHNPSTHLIDHALDDAPGEWLLFTTVTGAAIGAVSREKGNKGEGALVGASIGLGVGLAGLLLRAIITKN